MKEIDPRHKVLHCPEAMEDWELFAVLLGKGTKQKNVQSLSREILFRINGLGGLAKVSSDTLFEILGLGRAKIATLLAAKEIANRLKLEIIKSRNPSFAETCQLLSEYLQIRTVKEKRECFFLITFSHNKSLIATRLIAKGSLSEVGVYPRDIIKHMLDDGASFVIITHNHPNEKSIPSRDDMQLFARLKEMLLPLEIELLDQWIFGIDGIHSCNENKKIYSNDNSKTEDNSGPRKERLCYSICG